MELEKQVCSLELALRLKELNVKQDSYFYWFNYQETGWIVEPHGQLPSFAYPPENFPPDDICISAFTCAELGELLFNFQYYAYNLEITIDKMFKTTEDFYRLTNNLNENIIDELSEADCRARLLIFLLENGMMEIPNE